MGVGLWEDVAGVWGMWGGLVCCPWDSQGDEVQLLFLLLFALAFWSGVGCDFGECVTGGCLGWCLMWGELQAFKFARVIKNRTLIYKGLTITFFGHPILGAWALPECSVVLGGFSFCIHQRLYFHI